MESYFLGIDLGTSGARTAILDIKGRLIYSSEEDYKNGIKYPQDWQDSVERLIVNIPDKFRLNISGIAIDGTSGTILACDKNGKAYGPALPYYLSHEKYSQRISNLVEKDSTAFSTSSSLARALALFSMYGLDISLRHQADWITGNLIANWDYGEEGNNIRLGWDLKKNDWPESFYQENWINSLPKIIPSGEIIGEICPKMADILNVNKNIKIISGTTDSNAAVLATRAEIDDGITILGSTTVLKRFVKEPINAIGLTNHRIGSKWICGGASNSGGQVLKQFFNSKQLQELSRQINPYAKSGTNFRPLPYVGERFPVDDPSLKPILKPRPISDSLFLHGLLEGIAKIEHQGWQRFEELGIPPPKRIITLGGGSRNNQWRKIRENIIGIPITTCTLPTAAGTAILVINSLTNTVHEN